MPEKVLYRYKATSSDGSYIVHPVTETQVQTTDETLSAGDQFAVDGKVYTYLGGADTAHGAEVGFFAEARSGHPQFFSLEPISHSERLTLNASQEYTICFMAGTRIATPAGAACVERLAPGDLVLTATGAAAAVRWVGRQTVATRFANPARVLPIRIRAGALGEHLPERDLLVSPGHALLLDGVLVEAGALINGTSIVREADVPETFMYYHVELDDHAVILAEGVPAETFVDNIDRLAFDNWDEHRRVFPEGHDVAELPYPRASSARQVPAAIVRRLAARAGQLARASRDAA